MYALEVGASWGQASLVLGNNGESGHFCLISILGVKRSSLLIKYGVSYSCFKDTLLPV